MRYAAPVGQYGLGELDVLTTDDLDQAGAIRRRPRLEEGVGKFRTTRCECAGVVLNQPPSDKGDPVRAHATHARLVYATWETQPSVRPR